MEKPSWWNGTLQGCITAAFGGVDNGEEFDEESQLPALAHMAWNAIAMLAIWHDKMKTMKEKELRHNEFDNYNYD